jgi:hypothetical protein
MFEMQIETDNSAFDDNPASELARILRETADKLESGCYLSGLWENCARDVNGNVVDRLRITE